MKNEAKNKVDKNRLSQEDLKNGLKTFEPANKSHAALETPDGKNNGAELAIFKHQRKSHT